MWSELWGSCGWVTGRVDVASLTVRPVGRDEIAEFNRCLDAHHWLGHRLTGEVLRYVATVDDEWVAVLGFRSAALSCKPRDTHIGWSRSQQYRRLRFVLNNQRFCVLPGGRIPNLASAVLSRALKRLSGDCVAAYGHPVVAVETFTDPSRHAGTCYAASNFTVLGPTLGYRRSAGRYVHHGQPKLLWWHPLRRDVSQVLCASFDHPALRSANLEHPMLDLDTIDFVSLRSHLEAYLDDWRKPRGVRHSHAALFAIATAAALSGARSVRAIAEFAADLPPEALAQLGARQRSDGTYVAPHADTFRRAFSGVDVEQLDTVIGSWLTVNLDAGIDAVAIDGKTLRGARTGDSNQVHLLAAMVHNHGTVIAQQQVDTKTNEITHVRPLLNDLDLDGAVVTADALHAQRDHATFIAGDKGADYVFTVKGNQPTLFAEITDRFDTGSFSPSPPDNEPRPQPDRNPLDHRR